MSSKVLISGDKPPCTHRNCWFIRAGEGSRRHPCRHHIHVLNIWFYLLKIKMVTESAINIQEEKGICLISQTFSLTTLSGIEDCTQTFASYKNIFRIFVIHCWKTSSYSEVKLIKVYNIFSKKTVNKQLNIPL